MGSDSPVLRHAPPIPGLSFRRLRGPEDFAGMAEAINEGADADGAERCETAENLQASYAHLGTCDLTRDFILAEVQGRVVGYTRALWEREVGGEYSYGIVGFLAPDWRRRGLGRAMLRWAEGRLREIAAGHPAESPKHFDVFCDQAEAGRVALLQGEGYAPVRWFFEMLRPDLEDIADFPLPAGIEVRSALPEHYRAVWEAWMEALKDHWGFSLPTEDEYLGWLGAKRYFQPELWQVAWDTATGQVAGNVLGYIDREENEKYRRERGWTENIAVGRSWRRRGLARALISRSLRAQKAAGMKESALGVDSESLTGATRVYEACGFRTVKTNSLWRKAL
jgi:GNAT superfamily N-acetyltransferase